MEYSRFSKEETLFQARLKIHNSLNDETILSAVTPFGYAQEKLLQGDALYNEAGNLYAVQNKEYGDVDAAQATFDDVKEKTDGTYKMDVSIARLAFKKDVRAFSTLDLNGRRATTLSGWINQVQGFYRAILAEEEWKIKMAGFGRTEEKLVAQLEAVEEVSRAAESIKKEKGDAQNATQVRDLKFEELVEWLRDYDVIARIALADQPQLLEKLGIVVKA